jgi:Xaa-Pro aminopeptidase
MYYTDDRTEIARQAREKVFAAAGDDVDVIVSTDVLHVGYISGYRSILLDTNRHMRNGIVATRERTLLITVASDGAAALETLQDPANIYRYGNFYVFSAEPGKNYEAMPPASPSFFDAIGAALKSVVKPNSTVGLDAVTDSDYGQLKTLAGTTRSTKVRNAFLTARRVKLPGEIEKLRIASRITEQGLEKAASAASEGMTELDIAKIIAAEIIGEGGIPRFMVVTAGARSALVDAYATPNRLRKGDLVRLDLGCSYNGYWADMARTWVVGEPTDVQRNRYQALLDGELAQIAQAKAGVTAASVYDVAMRAVRKGSALPDYQRNHCGHGIGLVAHEHPDIAPMGADTVLEAGMVLCVETPFYEMGWGGMMVEDTFVVTDGEPDLLTHSDRALRSI